MRIGLLSVCVTVLGCGASAATQNTGERQGDATTSDVAADRVVEDVGQAPADPTGPWTCPMDNHLVDGGSLLVTLRITPWERGVAVAFEPASIILPSLRLVADADHWRLESPVRLPPFAQSTTTVEEVTLRWESASLRFTLTASTIGEAGGPLRQQQSLLCFRATP
ncbi:MAG: hypothetical protein Q8S73_03610 [Deltaproteobacteria bacterium]|nr:hypothetical protein [Myxococcales bacterium]MDP3213166.1 hypothetical protein [Deltaproteobacteria bacterium]